MKFLKYIVTSFLMIYSLSAMAQKQTVDTTGVIVRFPVNITELNRGYMNNASALDSLAEVLNSIQKDGNRHITGFNILSSASPEGAGSYNAKLSDERAQSIRNFVQNYGNYPDSMFKVTSLGADWEGALKMLNASDIKYKNEAANIIEHTPLIVRNAQGKIVDSRRRQMMNLRGGTVWNEMLLDFYPFLRRSEIQLYITFTEPAEPVVAEIAPAQPEVTTQTVVPADTVKVVSTPVDTVAEDTYAKVPFFALTTNMLYDAATALNFGIEIPIKDRWSVTADYLFPWWVVNHNATALQILHWDLGARYWFGDRTNMRVLTGLFAGTTVGGGYYDVEPHGTGHQGEFLTASLNGGYAVKLNDNFSIDFALGLGWMGTKYRYYRGEENNKYLVWQHNGNFSWFGPTQAKITLVWLFYHRVNNDRKGGRK